LRKGNFFEISWKELDPYPVYKFNYLEKLYLYDRTVTFRRVLDNLLLTFRRHFGVEAEETQLTILPPRELIETVENEAIENTFENNPEDFNQVSRQLFCGLVR